MVVGIAFKDSTTAREADPNMTICCLYYISLSTKSATLQDRILISVSFTFWVSGRGYMDGQCRWSVSGRSVALLVWKVDHRVNG